MKAFNLGLLLLAIGVVYLLGNLGIIEMPHPEITSLWPLIPLLAGLNAVLSAVNRFVRYRSNTLGSLLNGLFWTALGTAFLARNLGVWTTWNFSARDLFWPLFLVWLGVQMVTKAGGSCVCVGEQKNPGKYKKHDSTIGELKLSGPWTLTKNSYNMWVGEMFIDVTKAFVPDKDSYLELSALAGELTVIVPKEMALEVHADIMAGEVKILDQHESGVFRKTHYRSSFWDTAEKRLTLDIRMKAGEVTVRDI